MKELNESRNNLYLYGDISKFSTEELKSALKSFKSQNNPEGISRVEGELLNRKEIKVGYDFVLDENIQGPRKKDDKFFKLK
ncbi:MAG TPA: hypothetical protein PLO44_01320 [Candidatus Paceibacterota bacterium]|nr:hypothetical protein [Candidatus Paceibacterota bacterium]